MPLSHVMSRPSPGQAWGLDVRPFPGLRMDVDVFSESSKYEPQLPPEECSLRGFLEENSHQDWLTQLTQLNLIMPAFFSCMYKPLPHSAVYSKTASLPMQLYAINSLPVQWYTTYALSFQVAGGCVLIKAHSLPDLGFSAPVPVISLLPVTPVRSSPKPCTSQQHLPPIFLNQAAAEHCNMGQFLQNHQHP